MYTRLEEIKGSYAYNVNRFFNRYLTNINPSIMLHLLAINLAIMMKIKEFPKRHQRNNILDFTN